MNTTCAGTNCPEPAVSGGPYCEDHQLEAQLAARKPRPTGSLAELIRNAKAKGLIAPVSGYSGN